MSASVHHNALVDHLAWWGLRRFDSDAAYFQWQREVIPPPDLTRLAELAQQKSAHGGGTVAAEIAFYDYSVRPSVLLALYSQRYDYYMAVGPLVAARLGSANAVLDVGCGPGVLTTFYANQYPDREFVGIDRSAASIAVAQQRAEQLGLNNVRFELGDLDLAAPTGSYDCIVATHALLQAEHDPGVPSADWRTFERSREARLQADFEVRTGLGPRLDRLCAALASEGRLLIFEKTRPLGRRIPLQRAFASRSCVLLECPVPIRYTVVEEVAEDGPFYVMGHASNSKASCCEWDESPEMDRHSTFDIAQLGRSAGQPGEPLYENHTVFAQSVWAQLREREVVKEMTQDGPQGRQLHVETGRTQGLIYLYCSNTFDQRQVVLVKPEQSGMLEAYYQEIVKSIDERMAG